MNKARVPFAIYSKAHGKVIGTTSIFNIADRDDKVEVGYSWIGKGYQGQGFNESAKTLLLNMLFEDYDVARVSFFCDEENIASSKALLKIGAHKEGILRNFKKLNKKAVIDGMVTAHQNYFYRKDHDARIPFGVSALQK